MADPTDLAAARQRMLVEQLERRGVTAPRVLEAMARVPRHHFVSPESLHEAYADRALAIECGQTISQPLIVGLMTQALDLTGAESVLEIGTGSGYQTAILSLLAASVVTIERHAELSAAAARRLADLGHSNVVFVLGDGAGGWPPGAPYDRIIVTAAAAQVPPQLWEQLRERGLIVIPLGDADSQVLQAIRKVGGAPQAVALSGCRFVPFVGVEPAG